MLEHREKRRDAGRGAVKPGVVLAFYRGRGSAGEGWPGLTPVLMALTPLKTGGGVVKRGIKGGKMMAGW
jgi:hypothetical protein